MSVIIGHASINENGKTTGGNAGDQTGKEVCMRNWYAKNWDYVLRCKNDVKAELMATACEKACKNDNIGYNQSQRNTLRTQAYLNVFRIENIRTKCSCDCSSLMTVCAECAGIPIPYNNNNAPTTKTMKSAFINTGFFDVITGSLYTGQSNYLKRGDILVKEGSHTVMVLSNGQASASAKISKNYTKNSTYTTCANLYIRKTPEGEKLKHNNITIDAQKHSYFDEYGYAILNKGTRVTCLGVEELNGKTWLKIPSGYVCAVNNKGEKYII